MRCLQEASFNQTFLESTNESISLYQRLWQELLKSHTVLLLLFIEKQVSLNTFWIWLSYCQKSQKNHTNELPFHCYQLRTLTKHNPSFVINWDPLNSRFHHHTLSRIINHTSQKQFKISQNTNHSTVIYWGISVEQLRLHHQTSDVMVL